MELQSILTQALERRQQLRGKAATGPEATDAWRVVDGETDGLPGLTIDDFAGHWVVSTRDRPWPQGLESAALRWAGSVWWRRLERGDKAAADWVAGAQPDPGAALTMREHGLRYEIDPAAGYSPGLFLDQRDNRRRVRERLQPGQRMLNLYAYTCGFSVAAAAAGAVTSSVDLSGHSLAWGKRNFELNGFDPAAHHFVRGDAFEWLSQFARKGRRFDLAVADPPTFSRGGRRKVWRVEHDLPELVAATAAVLNPGAWLMVSSNCRRLEPTGFFNLVEDGLATAGRSVSLREAPSMPDDFRGSDYLNCLWVRLV